jgi:hypothetical protein
VVEFEFRAPFMIYDLRFMIAKAVDAQNHRS